MRVVYYIDMQSRKARKRVVQLIKNQQQLALDKLLEISCLAEDKFVDQSRLLSVEHVFQQNLAENGRFDQGLKFIGKHKRASTKVYTEIRSFCSTKYKIRGVSRKWGGLISNKLQSNQVFVGLKVKRHIETKIQEMSAQVIPKQKGRTYSTVNHYQATSIPVRKLTTQWSNQPDFTMFKQKNGERWHSFKALGEKHVENKQQKVQNVRDRLKTDLFFNRNNRHRRLTYSIPKFQ